MSNWDNKDLLSTDSRVLLKMATKLHQEQDLGM